MSDHPKVIEASIIEGQDCTLRGRFEDAAGDALLQAGISTIHYYVYGFDDAVAISNAALTVASVINDVLQGWTEDDTGYNFEGVVPWAKLAHDGKFVYWVEIIITLGSGEKIPGFYKLHQNALLSLP